MGLQESFNSVMGYKLLPCMYGSVIYQQVKHMPECCPEQDWI